MSSDDISKALDEMEANTSRVLSFYGGIAVTVSPLRQEIIRRTREHIAAQASDDEVEAAVAAFGDPDPTNTGYRDAMRSALIAAKIKTAEAVAKAIETIRLSFPQEAEDLVAAAVEAERERIRTIIRDYPNSEIGRGASDSSPIPPERVPEALRELADIRDADDVLNGRLEEVGLRINIRSGGETLRQYASRLEAELAAFRSTPCGDTAKITSEPTVSQAERRSPHDAA